MQAVDVYLMYCALKAHFGKGDYDFVKYGGKSSATKDSFWKRTDRLFFVKTQRKYKKKQVIQDYLVSNFVCTDYSAKWIVWHYDARLTESTNFGI